MLLRVQSRLARSQGVRVVMAADVPQYKISDFVDKSSFLALNQARLSLPSLLVEPAAGTLVSPAFPPNAEDAYLGLILIKKTLCGTVLHSKLRLRNNYELEGSRKAELGRHAYEQRIPIRLENQLRSNDGRKTDGLIPVVAALCQNDDTVEVAYVCHPMVKYISKAPREGPYFCGYHNIQMLISCITGAKTKGHDRFVGVPTILELQDLVEDAWDRGISSDGRGQTGGIRMTRKYIGTPEAQALFRSLEIPCRAGAHSTSTAENGLTGWESLLNATEQYFLTGASTSPNEMPFTSKVFRTNLPPIYLQRPRHSLTIIGFEVRVKKNGSRSRNLLVFDPAYWVSKCLRDISSGACKASDVHDFRSKRSKKLLKPYRRGKKQLQRYAQFETLTLT